jgi:hypothetical protein
LSTFSEGPTAPRAEDSSPPSSSSPPGIRGWLIVPFIGTLISPFYQAYGAYLTGGALLKWNALPILNLKILLVLEFLANVVMAAAWAYTLYLFCKRSREFPRWFIGASLVTLVIIISDSLGGALIGLDFDASDIKSIIQAAVPCMIWIPYMLRSKRVKETFVG